MKDMKKYYLALAVLIPAYIILGIIASRSEIFNYFSMVLVVIWVICVIAFFKSRNFAKRKKKHS